MQIILASQNKNKLKELSTVFQKKLSKHSLVFPNKVLNVIEDKETIKENAEKKASEYFKFYDLPVIADDSGLFVEALNGAPGVHSARFSGEDADDEKNNLHIKTIYNSTVSDERIFFLSSLVRSRFSTIRNLENNSVIQTSHTSEIRNLASLKD